MQWSSQARDTRYEMPDPGFLYDRRLGAENMFSMGKLKAFNPSAPGGFRTAGRFPQRESLYRSARTLDGVTVRFSGKTKLDANQYGRCDSERLEA